MDHCVPCAAKVCRHMDSFRGSHAISRQDVSPRVVWRQVEGQQFGQGHRSIQRVLTFVKAVHAGTKRIAVRALTSGCFSNTASSQSVAFGFALPSGLALFTGGCRPSRVPCMEAKQAVADKNRQDRSSSRPRYLWLRADVDLMSSASIPLISLGH